MEPVIKQRPTPNKMKANEFPLFVQVRDELDRDQGTRDGKEQPRDPVRQVHTAVFGEHPQQVQEDHPDSGNVAHTNVVLSARVHFGAVQYAVGLSERMVRAVLHVCVHMVVRCCHISRTGEITFTLYILNSGAQPFSICDLPKLFILIILPPFRPTFYKCIICI